MIHVATHREEELLDQIAALATENARLTEQMRQFTADLEDSTLSVGEAYAYRSLPGFPQKKG